MPHVSLESHPYQSNFGRGTCSSITRESHANHLDLLARNRRRCRIVSRATDGRYRPRRPGARAGPGPQHSAAADRLGGQRTTDPAEPRDGTWRNAAPGASDRTRDHHHASGTDPGRGADTGLRAVTHPVHSRADPGGGRCADNRAGGDDPYYPRGQRADPGIDSTGRCASCGADGTGQSGDSRVARFDTRHHPCRTCIYYRRAGSHSRPAADEG